MTFIKWLFGFLSITASTGQDNCQPQSSWKGDLSLTSKAQGHNIQRDPTLRVLK